LKARGFDPRALRDYWIEVGMKSAEIQFSWDNFYSVNRSLIDKDTKRFFFVPSPAEVRFEYDDVLTADLFNHPEYPEMGKRKFRIEPVDGVHMFLLPSEDLEEVGDGAVIRLKDLCNIRILDHRSGEAEFEGNDISAVRNGKGRIIQWAQQDDVAMSLIMPDGKVIEGIAEKDVRDAASKGENVQFERVGYFRTFIQDGLKANFMHP
jgi:glutamyl-tRNA synthetase